MFNDKKVFLQDYCTTAEKHAKSLMFSLEKIQNLQLTTQDDYEKLDMSCTHIIDSAIMRFSQLQDIIGTKIFPTLLFCIKKDSDKLITVLDRLNELEKLAYLPKTNWWLQLRNLRNAFSHDYSNDYDAIARNFNKLVLLAPELVTYWYELKTKIEYLLSIED